LGKENLGNSAKMYPPKERIEILYICAGLIENFTPSHALLRGLKR
jgi:hypothetical protein